MMKIQIYKMETFIQVVVTKN